MKYHILLISIILVSGMAVGQTYSERSPGERKDNTQPRQPSICGDGVCKPVEEGLCREDCPNSYNIDTGEESDNETLRGSESNKLIEKSVDLDRVSLEVIILLAIILAITGGSYKIIQKEKKRKESDEQWFEDGDT